MDQEIKCLLENFFIKIKNINEIEQLKQLEIKYLGKNGILFFLFQEIKKFPVEKKRIKGQKINLLKQKCLSLLEEKKKILENQLLNDFLKKDKIDVTLPHLQLSQGNIHPLNQIIKQIENFFLNLGYSIYDGDEIVSDFYNFEMLNIDKEHPARDIQDSFYLNQDYQYLLRTHTSSVQVKAMLEKKSQPLKIISSGKVYRRDKDDDSHSHQFIQLEGFAIDHINNINIRILKEILVLLLQNIFGKQQELRFRPSYFPFTKPSLEVDLVIKKFQQKNIYLEILGAGLIHPQVLSRGGYNPEKYSGLAFGLGIERIAMLKYGIEKISYFYQNNINFLNQFIK
ncbi:phenylalanine--tRNA ligase subunit alpha [Candidatus Phytoplasma pini]|uniref:phenylalanine--tRNA ligase subunit alpha n=1 Tax=Candidatus Phytoplasma pini TaxID=267362 RepID=UPI003B9684AD